MNWQETEFEKLFAVPSRNGIYKAKEHHGSGVPIVNMGELFGFDRITDQPMGLIQMSDSELEKSGLMDGDLLFGRRSLVEEGAGKCSLVYRPQGLMTFESSIIRVRLNQKVADPEFYFYYFKSRIGRSRVKSIIGGAAVKGIRGSDLKAIKVHVPLFDQQKKIAATLRDYDDLIETNRRRIQLLEEAARRIYTEWFVRLRFPGHECCKVVDGLPEGWRRGSLFDFADVQSGGTPKTGVPGYWEGDIPFFTPKDCPENFYVRQTEKSLTEEGLASCNSRLFAKNTVFLTARGTVGKIALAQQEMAMNQSCYALVSRDNSSQLYLFCATDAATTHLRQAASGGVFDAIVVDTFRRIPFMWPDGGVIAKFDQAVSPLFSQVETLLLQNTKLQQARDLLLPKLMSGALRV